MVNGPSSPLAPVVAVPELPRGTLVLPETSAGMRRLILELAWPVILQNFFQTLLFFSDSIMVGALGTYALAAMAIAMPLVFTVQLVLIFLGSAAVATVGRALGERHEKAAQARAATALLAGFALGVLVAVGGFLFAERMVAPFVDVTLQADVWVEATGYVRIVYASFGFTALSMVAMGVLRAAGDTRTPMWIGGASVVANIVGNYLLIFGAMGLPKLGVHGAGMATALSRLLECLLLMSFLFSPRAPLSLQVRSFLRVRWQTLWEYIRIAAPAAVEPLILQSGVLVFVGQLSKLGSAAMAAHRAAMTVESLSFLPGLGFGAAAAAVVGQCLGARKPDLADRGARQAIFMSILLMATVGSTFAIFPSVWAGLFSDNPQVLEPMILCLYIAAVEVPLVGLTLVTQAALRGAGDTARPLLTSLLGMWGVRVPLVWIAIEHLELGLVAAWAIMVLDWLCRGAAVFWLFREGRWKKVRV